MSDNPASGGGGADVRPVLLNDPDALPILLAESPRFQRFYEVERSKVDAILWEVLDAAQQRQTAGIAVGPAVGSVISRILLPRYPVPLEHETICAELIARLVLYAEGFPRFVFRPDDGTAADVAAAMDLLTHTALARRRLAPYGYALTSDDACRREALTRLKRAHPAAADRWEQLVSVVDTRAIDTPGRMAACMAMVVEVLEVEHLLRVEVNEAVRRALANDGTPAKRALRSGSGEFVYVATDGAIMPQLPRSSAYDVRALEARQCLAVGYMSAGKIVVPPEPGGTELLRVGINKSSET